VSAVVGRDEGETAEMYRSEGFEVEIVRAGGWEEVTHDLRLHRVRLCTRDGLVERATQG
jgi:hypothetical protein